MWQELIIIVIIDSQGSYRKHEDSKDDNSDVGDDENQTAVPLD
jgi:hypothetical protein